MVRKIILFFFLIVGLNAQTPTYENVTKLYIATFNRTPDVGGLNYWVKDSGLELEGIAKSFFEQPEAQKKFYDSGMTIGEFINNVYLNVFERFPDEEGYAYWVGELYNNRILPSNFILAVINGAQGDDAMMLENKTETAMIQIEEQLNDDNESTTYTCKSFNSTNYWAGSKELGSDCIYYSSNNRLKEEIQYVDNKRHGYAWYFNEDGDLIHKYAYWNGNREGSQIEYRKLASSGNDDLYRREYSCYENTCPAGGWDTTYFPNSDTVYYKSYYNEAGEKEGFIYEYNESGELVRCDKVYYGPVALSNCQ